MVDTSNISSKTGCEQLIRNSMKLGPVGGIFNLAVLLRDAIFDNQDVEKFIECMAPKAVATKYLDEISRVLCPELQYFVVFSSVSCGRGNAGQSNYGMANSVMERIMEQRHSLGLPAKAIQWGAVGEVGLVADMQEDKIDMEIGGTLQQRISSCLEEMDTLLFAMDPIVASMVVAEKKIAVGVQGNIVDTVMNIMGIRDIKQISTETTLPELGMDSLMAVELKQILEREYDMSLSTQELRALNFAKIIELGKQGKGQSKEEKSDSNLFQFTVTHLGNEAQSEETVLFVEPKKVCKSNCLGIVIPGIEGTPSHSMLNMCKNLEFPHFIVQYRNEQACRAQSLDDLYNLIRNVSD
jgi:fatty acid synthase, animal type